jgi:hypothetical protein
MTELSVEIPGFKEKLKIWLIGQTDTMILNEIGQLGLSDTLDVIPHKEHRAGLKLLAQSAVLLLPLNDAPNAKAILREKCMNIWRLDDQYWPWAQRGAIVRTLS